MSLSSAALYGFGQAALGLDAASANAARSSDPTATATAVAGGQLVDTGTPIDPAADSVTLTGAAIQMAVAAKLVRVERETQKALIDLVA
jgi:hypothetical protein